MGDLHPSYIILHMPFKVTHISYCSLLLLGRVGNWFKPPGLNHGLNRLKFNKFMPLAGINSVLPGLNWFKPVNTTGWNKSI